MRREIGRGEVVCDTATAGVPAAQIDITAIMGPSFVLALPGIFKSSSLRGGYSE